MKKFIIENVKKLCANSPVTMSPGSYRYPWNFDEELDNPCQVEWIVGNTTHEITHFSDRTLKYEIIEFEILPNGIQTKKCIFDGQCTLTKKEHIDLSNKLIELLDQYFNYISESYRIE